jgi:hypothetical protein
MCGSVVREPPGSGFDVAAFGEPFEYIANRSRIFRHLGAQVAIVVGYSNVLRLVEELVTEERSTASSSSERPSSGCGRSRSAQFYVERGGGPVKPPHGSMVAFGVQPEFTCKLAVSGEEHDTDDADDVAGVRFVSVLKLGSDGLIERLFVHGAACS